MAAYAALVSLAHITHDIQHHHSPPISIDEQQLQSLSQILTFLQEFLEASKSPVPDGDDEADLLRLRIVDAAHAAEDVIESHLVNAIRTHHQEAAEDVIESHLIHHQQAVGDSSESHLTRHQHTSSIAAKISRFFNCFRSSKKPEIADSEAAPFEMSTANTTEDVIESHLVDLLGTHHQQNGSIADDDQAKSNNFYQDLQRVIDEMNVIKQMAVEMDTEQSEAVHNHKVSKYVAPLRSASSSSTAMVCSDAVLYGLMDKLVGGELDRRIIPVVGMGGIGKTTLALNIYERQNIKDHFDRCAWITISQIYNTRELICDILAQFTDQSKEQFGGRSEGELGVNLHQYLSNRRYLIVMDDMWSIDAWEQIQQYFPEKMNGSRILVTTRLSQLCSQLNPNYSFKMEFLDEDSSWDLFSKTVFGDRSFHPELIEIGKNIAHNCRGLPLSIVVVGGLLRKMENTRGSWESIRDNLSSVVNLENDKHCLRLLKLSYNHLPVYLKPCFLFMGMFEEDDEIKVSTIINLWVSEGFLKPMNDRSLEAIAMEFLKDLVDRNLILIDRMGSTGNIKLCKIHDLLRDLCLAEGEKEGFHHAVGRSQVLNRQCRRFLIARNTSEKKVVEDLQSMPYARSVICENGKVPACQNFRLLRTFHAYKFRTYEDKSYMNSTAFQYVNLRHLAVEVRSRSSIFSSLNLFWNLHTLIVSCPDYNESIRPDEIWKMPRLRHVEFPDTRVCLPDPPPSDNDDDVVIMKNLQVLKGLKNFKCSKEVVKRIPNIKKLKTQYWQPELIFYDDFITTLTEFAEAYSVSNIQFLSKLEQLHISCDRESREALYLLNITFPQSLKKLTLSMNVEFEWEDILERIGSLPHLEKLKLWIGCFKSGKWEMVEGQFPQLKYLGLYCVTGLKQWTVEDSSVMPHLEKFTLFLVEELEVIPSEIGYITTLQEVQLTGCGESMVRSAKAMVDEQVYEQGDDLSFRVKASIRTNNKELQRLSAPPYFTVICADVVSSSAA